MSKPKLAVIVEGDLSVAGPDDVGNIEGLGTAATRDVGTAEGDVLISQAGTTFRNGKVMSSWPLPATHAENISMFGRSNVTQYGIYSHAAAVQFSGAPDTYGRLSAAYGAPNAWIQGGLVGGTSWTAELIHTLNILHTTGQSTQYPMSQKAVTDAINARGFADASGVLTATSGTLSNDMSSFLSQTTKATMRSNLEVPQLNATATEQGGLKARLTGTTLYLTNNGTNP